MRYVVSFHYSVVVRLLAKAPCYCGATDLSCQGRLLARCPRPYGLEHPYLRKDYVVCFYHWANLYKAKFKDGGGGLFDRTVELLHIILTLWKNDRNNLLALV